MGKAMVKNRLFYRIPVELVTPISISSGNSELTDHDVILTDNGMPFVPGSSIAGAVRAHLEGNSKIDLLFGNGKKMSRIIFSDLVFDKRVRISSRDGIALEEGLKITKDTGKFDYQIVETHAQGTIFAECVLYNNDKLSAKDVRKTVLDIISGMNCGEIRFGFKKTRGLGCVKAESFFSKEFDFSKPEDVKSYLDFCDDIYDESKYNADKIQSDCNINSDRAVIRILLKLEGGISIRTYSAVPNDPDFKHLTVGDKEHTVPVIPGSSWNGAVRSRTFDIFNNELGLGEDKKKELEKDLREFWGDCGDMKFQASKIIFSESELKDSKPVRMTRNKINRFDSSTCEGALYTETAYFGGNTELEIMFRDCEKYQWCIYLVELALKDLKNGLLSVGGQTAVGRGIFSGEKEDIINIDMDAARECLVDMIKR